MPSDEECPYLERSIRETLQQAQLKTLRLAFSAPHPENWVLVNEKDYAISLCLARRSFSDWIAIAASATVEFEGLVTMDRVLDGLGTKDRGASSRCTLFSAFSLAGI
ncbi:hypothetical protein NUU61_007845 [Penicillium alfredii]|uniref:Uncharacterized protein n=1 Tax=Penicillium alfredii TaxID=1506179 RepID=A0A9W9ER86_9EURO|nr:uncharacterized protein NUU61_007845 [Penicillium alfredii]KAJ5086538.1 hypothetical protein NUU61_007845 [Penicillium alfredii]